MKADRNRDRLAFGSAGRREVVADFGGGRITSDGGALLIGAAERKTRIVETFVRAAMQDHRDPGQTEHSLLDLCKQRVFGLVLGLWRSCFGFSGVSSSYEDLNNPERADEAILATTLTRQRSPYAQAGTGIGGGTGSGGVSVYSGATRLDSRVAGADPASWLQGRTTGSNRGTS